MPSTPPPGSPPASEDLRRDILRAWTDRLYAEYDNVLFHFRVRLKTPVIRIEPLTSRWGQWSPFTRTLTLSQALIERYSWDVVIEVLKHEMAHQVVTEQLGSRDLHGPAFQRACAMLGVAAWAASASGELPEAVPSWRDRALGDDDERLLKRAEKLLALAESGNEHEAALAMQRVRQLYAKYNLERLAASREAAYVYCVINRKQKRISTDDSMIFSILTEHFFVRAIFASLYDAQDLCQYKVVELLGTRENVLIAEYVCHFLRAKVDALWADFRRRGGAAAGARRSYMLGALSGFRDKLAAAPLESGGAAPSARDRAATTALIRQGEGELTAFVGSRYPKLASRRWGGGQGDRASFAAGVADGGTITIHRGLTHQGGNHGLRLPAASS